MPNLDLFHYVDFDSIDAGLAVGDDAGEKLGEDFEGLYVVAVGPPIHKGRKATVVVAHEHRRDRMQELERFFGER